MSRNRIVESNFLAIVIFTVAVFTLLSGCKCRREVQSNPSIFRKVLTAQHPSGPPVIFIHGMSATMMCWDTLVTYLTADFKAKHDVWEFQYNWRDSIMVNGRALKDSVERVGLVKPVLIAHSMGGLVSRGYVASGGEITKLITLGTPHLGTPLANNISPFTPTANFPGPKDMKPDGNYLKFINNHLLDISNRKNYYVIAGQMSQNRLNHKNRWNKNWYTSIDKSGYKLFLLKSGKPDNDGLVPVSSALFSGSEVQVALDSVQQCDHFNLIKPVRAPHAIIDYINGF